MKNIILFVLCFLFCLSSHAQISSCKQFKTGNFLINDSVAGNVYVFRKKKYQYEVIPSKNIKIKYRIKWIDDCTYELRLLRILKGKSKFSMPSNYTARVKIVSKVKGGYNFQVSSEFFDQVYKNKMIKM